MGKKYSHLTYFERLKIAKFLNQGQSIEEIAYRLDRSPCTIRYELKRKGVWYTKLNTDLTETLAYSPELAQQQYEYNKVAKGADLKIGSDLKLADFIEDCILNKKYSPEAVLNKIKMEGLQFSVEIKSVNTIYNYIRKGVFYSLSMKDCPFHREEKKKRQKVDRSHKRDKGLVIEQRSDEVKNRETFGHWEMDTVVGKQKNSKCVLVFTERKTRFEIFEILNSKTLDEVVRAINRIERRMGSKFYKIFKTVTCDNGSEFSDSGKLQKALRRSGKRFDLYYCHPYSSWERGSNENQNRFLRRFYPKGTDFDKVLCKNDIKDIENWLNDYPRRIFNGQTARQLYRQELMALGF